LTPRPRPSTVLVNAASPTPTPATIPTTHPRAPSTTGAVTPWQAPKPSWAAVRIDERLAPRYPFLRESPRSAGQPQLPQQVRVQPVRPRQLVVTGQDVESTHFHRFELPRERAQIDHPGMGDDRDMPSGKPVVSQCPQPVKGRSGLLHRFPTRGVGHGLTGLTVPSRELPTALSVTDHQGAIPVVGQTHDGVMMLRKSPQVHGGSSQR